jgi:hypothetical protein
MRQEQRDVVNKVKGTDISHLHGINVVMRHRGKGIRKIVGGQVNEKDVVVGNVKKVTFSSKLSGQFTS